MTFDGDERYTLKKLCEEQSIDPQEIDDSLTYDGNNLYLMKWIPKDFWEVERPPEEFLGIKDPHAEEMYVEWEKSLPYANRVVKQDIQEKPTIIFGAIVRFKALHSDWKGKNVVGSDSVVLISNIPHAQIVRV